MGWSGVAGSAGGGLRGGESFASHTEVPGRAQTSNRLGFSVSHDNNFSAVCLTTQELGVWSFTEILSNQEYDRSICTVYCETVLSDFHSDNNQTASKFSTMALRRESMHDE